MQLNIIYTYFAYRLISEYLLRFIRNTPVITMYARHDINITWKEVCLLFTTNVLYFTYKKNRETLERASSSFVTLFYYDVNRLLNVSSYFSLIAASSFRILDYIQILSFKSVMNFGTNISSGYIYNLMSFHKIQIDFHEGYFWIIARRWRGTITSNINLIYVRWYNNYINRIYL